MKTYNVSKAAELMGMTEYRVKQLVKSHKLTDLKGRMRKHHWASIPKESIDKYLSNGNGHIVKAQRWTKANTEQAEGRFNRPLTILSKLELHLAQRLDRVEKKLDALMQMWS